jgi:hypothetical protein
MHCCWAAAVGYHWYCGRTYSKHGSMVATVAPEDATLSRSRSNCKDGWPDSYCSSARDQRPSYRASWRHEVLAE